MIVVMKHGATPEAVQVIVRRVEEAGLKAHVIVGTERTVVAAVGDKRNGTKELFESYDEVEQVVPILAPYKVASRETKPEATTIRTRGLVVGGGHIGVIAGPCSVESEEQILLAAEQVKAAGATGLRGGAFKPRTSPYAFQGMKEEGLKLLALAREKTGLAIVTEVMTPQHVDLVAKYTDVLQIGARNMQNFNLLKELGKLRMPVLLKRGIAATVEELLLSAEYIMSGGNYEVILCERGIRTFETYTRNTMDISAIPVVKKLSHLPIVADPSHGTGRRDLVLPMARAAVAAGADGLLVEVHHDPDHALSDGAQTLRPEQFSAMMHQSRIIASAVGRTL